MKEQLNVLEILKLIPEDELETMKFKSLICGDTILEVDHRSDSYFPILSDSESYTEYGTLYQDRGECVIFPISMTWEELKDKYSIKTFTTLDGVKIRIGIDMCYAINKTEKRFTDNGVKCRYRGDVNHFAYFSDKTKAECYLAMLKGEDVEWFNVNEWILCGNNPDANDWIDITFRIKPNKVEEAKKKIDMYMENASLIDFTAINKVYIVDETGRAYNNYDCIVKHDIQDNGKTLKLYLNGDKRAEQVVDKINTFIEKQSIDINDYEQYSDPNPDLKCEWVKEKDRNVVFMITGYDPDSTFDTYLINSYWTNNKELFEEYTYRDGSPIGKLKSK